MKRSWKDVLKEIGLRLASVAAPAQPQQGAKVMPNPNDPALKAQKQQLEEQKRQLEAQMESDPDNADLEAQHEALEDQIKGINTQQKQARTDYRQANPPGKSGQGGQGQANAPGQQKKGQ